MAAAGLTLLDSTPDADPLVVLLFALFHDSMRESDGHDPEHGEPRAPLARRMRDAGCYELDEARLLTGLDTRFLAWLLQQGRPLYVVEGRQVGIGGMAEPVLADARIVEERYPPEVWTRARTGHASRL